MSYGIMIMPLLFAPFVHVTFLRVFARTESISKCLVGAILSDRVMIAIEDKIKESTGLHSVRQDYSVMKPLFDLPYRQCSFIPRSPPEIRRPQHVVIHQEPPLDYKPLTHLPAFLIPKRLSPNRDISRDVSPYLDCTDHMLRLQ